MSLGFLALAFPGIGHKQTDNPTDDGQYHRANDQIPEEIGHTGKTDTQRPANPDRQPEHHDVDDEKE
jgi:hypothetical protein